MEPRRFLFHSYDDSSEDSSDMEPTPWPSSASASREDSQWPQSPTLPRLFATPCPHGGSCSTTHHSKSSSPPVFPSQQAASPSNTSRISDNLRSLSLLEASLFPSSGHSTQISNSAAPYNVQGEPEPSKEFFSPTFQRSLAEGLAVAGEAAESMAALNSLADLNPDGQDLLAQAKTLAKFHASETRRVAILGDSGEGQLHERDQKRL